jgi:tetratricopeptide (TPR) repeat protein
MRHYLHSILFLISIVYCLKFNAQVLSPQVQREVDSLRRELVKAKEDTSKIVLRWKIGRKLLVPRYGFWDSIIYDAHRYNMILIESKALNLLAYFYSVNGDNEKAIKCTLESYVLALKAGDQKHLGMVWYNLALRYSNNNEIKKALEFCYKGIKYAELNKFKEMSAQLYGVASYCYFSAGEYKKSLATNLNRLKISKELQDNHGVLMTLMAIGTDYNALKMYKLKVKYYLECKQYLSYSANSDDAQMAYNSIGAAYSRLKQFDSAYKYEFKALDIAKEMNNTRGIVSVNTTLAGIYLEDGKTDMAKKTALKARELLQTVVFPLQLPELALVLRKIYEKEGNYKEALKYYEISVNAKDSLTSSGNKKQAFGKEFNYNLEKKESEIKILAQQNQIQNLQLNQNKYFIISITGIALLILIIAYLIIRQNRLNTRNQKIYLEQKLISSQMNPHFVFNSLNAILHLIMTKENNKAEIYLFKFANLIRDLLESNTKESLTLTEEVAILNGFLEMESRRFSKAFNYTINIDESIEKDTVNIPHMLVQPFIENAIWHGLLAKEGERNLQVTFSPDTAKTICCTVDDNGIGRAASSKKQSTFKKKSLALSFVKQRLELLSETLKIKCEVNIVDKVNESGEVLGTKIIIQLPLIN